MTDITIGIATPLSGLAGKLGTEMKQAIGGYLYNNLHKRKAVVVRTETAYGNSMSGQFEKAFTGYGGLSSTL